MLGSGPLSAADTPSNNPPSISPLPDPASSSSVLHVCIPGGLAHSSKHTKSPTFSVEVPKNMLALKVTRLISMSY